MGNKVRLNYTTTGEEGFDKQVSKLLTSIRGSEDGKTMLLALAAEGQSLGIVQHSSNVAARDGLGTVILLNASSTVGAGRIIFELSGGRKVGSSLLPMNCSMLVNIRGHPFSNLKRRCGVLHPR